MTELHSFKDGKTGCFSNIRMDDGDPCYISVAQTGVLVKKSKIGMFGAKLFDNSDVYSCANIAKALAYLYPENELPDGFSNPVLKAFTNAVMHCSSLAEVTRVLNEAIKDAEEKSGQPIDELAVFPG